MFSALCGSGEKFCLVCSSGLVGCARSLMKHTKHTSGPWAFELGKDTIWGDQMPVAYVSNHPKDSFANARLIAAAPDLLQVAEDYVLLCQLHDLEGAVYGAARAAIAKATGQV